MKMRDIITESVLTEEEYDIEREMRAQGASRAEIQQALAQYRAQHAPQVDNRPRYIYFVPKNKMIGDNITSPDNVAQAKPLKIKGEHVKATSVDHARRIVAKLAKHEFNKNKEFLITTRSSIGEDQANQDKSTGAKDPVAEMTSGGVATVAQPMGKMIRRGKNSAFPTSKKKKKD